VNKLVTYILYYYAGPGRLIYWCKLCCFLSRVSYLSFSGFARDSCNFLCRKLYDCNRETFLCFFRQYHQAFWPSRLFTLTLQIYGPFEYHAEVCGLLCVFFLWYCVVLFRQKLRVRLGTLPTIVHHPAPCCGRHCIYRAMLLGFLGTVNSPSSVTIGGSLSLVAQAIDHFRYFVLFPQASEPS